MGLYSGSDGLVVWYRCACILVPMGLYSGSDGLVFWFRWACILVQVEPRRLSLLMEKGGWESELRKTKGQLFYLQSLEKVITAYMFPNYCAFLSP